jgi:hypothetical protein
MSAPPRLKLNTTLAGVYLTTLTDADIQDLKTRLENFNFEVDNPTQYAEIEAIMNKLNGTLSANSDQMDLGSLFFVMEKVKTGSKRVSKPYEFVNVLLKIVGHIKGQTGGMNPYQPTKQKGSRTLIPNTRKINNNTNNNNYGEVYPVPNYPIPVGNAMSNALSEKQHIFNLFNRPRLEAKRQQTLYNAIKRPQHKATWNAVFSNTKKGGTRKKLPKSNTPKFRKQVINTIRARINLTNTHKARLIQRYTEAANAGLATPDEISALVSLAELKYYTPRTLRRRR